MAFGKAEVLSHLDAIEQHYLSKAKYLFQGNATFADSWVTVVLSLLELVGFDFQPWPKVKQWMMLMKSNCDYVDVSHAHEENVRKNCYGAGYGSTNDNGQV